MSTDTSSEPFRIDETFFERHAWKVLAGLSLVIGRFGVGDMLHGAADLQSGETVLMHSVTRTSWNELLAASPNVANLIDLKFRTEGSSYAAIALLTLTICLGGFRRGEWWAWYALWIFPMWMALTVYFVIHVGKDPSYGTPVPKSRGHFSLSCLRSCSDCPLGTSFVRGRFFLKRRQVYLWDPYRCSFGAFLCIFQWRQEKSHAN
jgi:hypothetical protein